VTKAARGDQDAFASLVDRTRALVCSIAMAILRDIDASQDVAQDVYLSAWRDLRKLRAPGSFLPWLRQMTRNRAHHVLRSTVRRRRVFAADDTDRLVESAATAETPASQLLEDERQRRLAGAIDELPEDAREVVTLYYREGQSVQQVADLLGMSQDAVKQRLSRARTKLRAALLDEIGDALRATAPGAAFTASVMALTMGAPATASAAALAGASATKAAGLGWLAQLAVAAATSIPGILGGVLGIVLGHRQVEPRAVDDEERLQLARIKHLALSLVVVFGVSLPLGYRVTRSVWAPILSYAAFLAVLAELYLRRVPRAIARRLEAERAVDPAAAARHRRDRRRSYLGFVGGAICGALGLAAGLLSQP
jgi:RNA polymerase sigma factor (sigma-70 family)